MNSDIKWLEDIFNCGCGGGPTEEEIERELRRIERERKAKPVIKPIKAPAKRTPARRVTKKEEPIPAPDVFTRKIKKEEAVPV